MVFSLRARPRPCLHNYRKEETDGGGSGQASKCKNRHSLADQVCQLTGLEHEFLLLTVEGAAASSILSKNLTDPQRVGAIVPGIKASGCNF